MIVNGLLGILTGGAIVALATSSFGADTVGVMGPGSTAGMLMLLGFGLVGLGMRGRRKSFQGAPIDGNYLALGMREVNLRGPSLFQRTRGKEVHDERRCSEREMEGNKEKLLGLLQQKYGYAKDKAEQEYKDFIGRYKGK